MTHDEPFLRAIFERPDDDVPRLQYADWLEEQGDPRGEFIRVQIEPGQLDEDDPRRPVLVRREKQLLKAHGQAWRSALPALDGVRWGQPERGFVASARFANSKTFVARIATVRKLVPLERIWVMNLTDPTFNLVADSPRLRGLTGLRLDFPRGILHQSQGLLTSPHLGRLRSFDLTNCVLGEADCRTLATSLSFAGLRFLRLVCCSITSAEARELFRKTSWKDLQKLDLSVNHLHRAGVEALAESTALRHLRFLRLACNFIQTDGVQALATSPVLTSLRHLELSINRVDDRGATALAESSLLANLHFLDLSSNCQIGNAGAKALAASPRLGRQTVLNLADNHKIDWRTRNSLKRRLGKRVRF